MSSYNVLFFGTGSVGILYTWVLPQEMPADDTRDITCACRFNYAEVAAEGFTLHSTIWGRYLPTRAAPGRPLRGGSRRVRPLHLRRRHLQDAPRVVGGSCSAPSLSRARPQSSSSRAASASKLRTPPATQQTT
ncbi:hypothetical protein F4780DRAFT_735544 [Xylariomycetidae sp. FL0641]|nr:hypothetical protein F4780DRAFT_735544 [Xylariomycetidae sp. FL0641]